MTMRCFLLVCAFALSAIPLAGCDTSRVDSINLTAEGMNFYNAGQMSKAIESFRKAIELHPQNHKAHFRLGLVYGARSGDHARAISSLQRAVELRPDIAEYWYQLGASQQSVGDALRAERNMADATKFYNEAKVSLQTAAELDEHYAEAYLRLARIHVELGQVSEAIDAYTNSIRADPTLRTGEKQGTAIAYKELAMLYAEYSFLDEAQQVLRNGIANNPGDVELECDLGNVYQEMKRYEEAIAHFKRAHELYEAQKGRLDTVMPAIFGLGFCHSALGEQAMRRSDIRTATEQLQEAKRWLDLFVANASGAELAGHRLAAQGRASEIAAILKELEEGRLPQYLIDEKEMQREREER